MLEKTTNYPFIVVVDVVVVVVVAVAIVVLFLSLRRTQKVAPRHWDKNNFATRQLVNRVSTIKFVKANSTIQSVLTGFGAVSFGRQVTRITCNSYCLLVWQFRSKLARWTKLCY